MSRFILLDGDEEREDNEEFVEYDAFTMQCMAEADVRRVIAGCSNSSNCSSCYSPFGLLLLLPVFLSSQAAQPTSNQVTL